MMRSVVPRSSPPASSIDSVDSTLDPPDVANIPPALPFPARDAVHLAPPPRSGLLGFSKGASARACLATRGVPSFVRFQRRLAPSSPFPPSPREKKPGCSLQEKFPRGGASRPPCPGSGGPEARWQSPAGGGRPPTPRRNAQEQAPPPPPRRPDGAPASQLAPPASALPPRAADAEGREGDQNPYSPPPPRPRVHSFTNPSTPAPSSRARGWGCFDPRAGARARGDSCVVWPPRPPLSRRKFLPPPS